MTMKNFFFKLIVLLSFGLIHPKTNAQQIIPILPAKVCTNCASSTDIDASCTPAATDKSKICVSSVVSANQNPGINAVDGNAGTLWESTSVTFADNCSAEPAKEQIIVDLLSEKSVQKLDLSYYQQCGCATYDASKLFVEVFTKSSSDLSYTSVAKLPFSLAFTTKSVALSGSGQCGAANIRYVKVVFNVCQKAYNKANLTDLVLYAPDGSIPSNLAATSTATTSNINWCGNPGDDYILEYKVNDEVAWTSINTKSTDYALTGLTPYTTYFVRVKKATGTAYDMATFSTTPDNNCLNYDSIKDPEDLSTYTFQNSPSPHNFSTMLGVTAYTNWDNIYSSVDCFNSPSPTTKNPFAPLASFARSFHLSEKDYEENGVQYTPAQRGALGPVDGSYKGLDLYRDRYCKWRKDFTDIHASIMIYSPNYGGSFPNGWWKEEYWGADLFEAYRNAKLYSKAFVAKMAPDAARTLINTIEIGNEPWGYKNPEFSRTLIRGMVDGIREFYGNNDPARWPIKVIPSAFQAHHYENTRTAYKDYMGHRIPCDMTYYLNGVNMHTYSFKDESLTWTHPEDPHSEFFRYKNTVRWLNTNMPNKKLYVTEIGWDSEVTDNGVGKIAQAEYLVRNYLLFSRHHIYRGAIFEAIDDSRTGLYGSSGIYTAQGSGAPASPKPSFHAMMELKTKMGSKNFIKALKEDNDAYVYLIGDGSTPTHVVAWKPTAINKDDNNTNAYVSSSMTMNSPDLNTWQIAANSTPEYIDGVTDNSKNYSLPVSLTSGNLTVNISATPLIIPIIAASASDCPPKCIIITSTVIK